MGHGRRLGPGAGVELGEDPRHVDARRLLGADLALRRLAGEQEEDLRCAGGQAPREWLETGASSVLRNPSYIGAPVGRRDASGGGVRALGGLRTLPAWANCGIEEDVEADGGFNVDRRRDPPTGSTLNPIVVFSVDR